MIVAVLILVTILLGGAAIAWGLLRLSRGEAEALDPNAWANPMREESFQRLATSTLLKLMGVDVCALGEHAEPGQRIRWRDDDVYQQLTLKNGRLVGAFSFGPWPKIGFTQDFIRLRKRLWPRQIQRFRGGGVLRGEPAGVAQWPESTVVCSCMGVTRGTLTAASCSSVEELARVTGASTVCGSCRHHLAALTGAVAGPPSRGAGLLVAAGATVVLGLAIAFAAPTPPATSVQQSDMWDLFYRDGWWRRASGFMLLAMSLAAAGLALRKRVRAFNFGQFRWWRLAHGAIGVASLAALIAHTGMRLGSGLNQALMVAFLATNVVGALAAVGLGRARWTFWLHLIAVWPLPVLLGFHVLSAYYF